MCARASVKVFEILLPLPGLIALKSNEFSFTLCDVQMMGLDGDELVREFRIWEASHRPPQCKQAIFAHTAYANDEVQERCRSAGMDGLVTKPLAPKTVDELLSYAAKGCISDFQVYT